jgi:hypothetical protein
MRKFSLTVAGVVVLAGFTASMALGKSAPRARPAQASKCGTLYTPPCTPPVLNTHIPPACKPKGSTISVPVSVKSNAGIKSLTLKFGSKTIKSVKYSNGPTSKSFADIPVSTAGLKSGVVYSITVKMVTLNHKTKTTTLHFTICATAPIFTG